MKANHEINNFLKIYLFCIVSMGYSQQDGEPKLDITAEQDAPVSFACLERICQWVTGCETSTCNSTYCGPFRMSRPYWIDAGRPTYKNEDPDSKTAFKNCAVDMFCSAKAVEGYMRKFRQDCNSDGKIDCDDYFSIHLAGGYGCFENKSSELSTF